MIDFLIKFMQSLWVNLKTMLPTPATLGLSLYFDRGHLLEDLAIAYI